MGEMATGLIFRLVRKISKSEYKPRYDCPSAQNSSPTTGRFFSEIWYLRISLKYIEKIQVPFNDTKNIGTLHINRGTHVWQHVDIKGW